MPVSQLLAKFQDCMKKLTKKLLSVMESTIESTMVKRTNLNTGEHFAPTKQTFTEELDEAAEVKTFKINLKLNLL